MGNVIEKPAEKRRREMLDKGSGARVPTARGSVDSPKLWKASDGTSWVDDGHGWRRVVTGPDGKPHLRAKRMNKAEKKAAKKIRRALRKLVAEAEANAATATEGGAK